MAVGPVLADLEAAEIEVSTSFSMGRQKPWLCTIHYFWNGPVFQLPGADLLSALLTAALAAAKSQGWLPASEPAP
jgi:hypothetical protein